MKHRVALLVSVVLAASTIAVPGDALAAQRAPTCETRTWNGFGNAGEPALQLNGHAAVSGGRLRVAPSATSRAGSAFTHSPVSLATDVSFSTYFQFQFSQPLGGGADGLVFVVQTVDNNVGSHGGGMGYQGLAKSLGVEFDSWHNTETVEGVPFSNDPNGSHAGVNLDGSLHSDPLMSVTPNLDDAVIRHAWVDYNGATDVLEVRLATTADRPAGPSMTKTVDLPSVLQSPDAFFGFTSATGAAAANHDVIYWQLESCYAPIADPSATVQLTADRTEFGFGVATIPVDAVEASALADADSGAPPDDIAATPLGSIDLEQSPTTQAAPLGSIPLGSIPLGSIPLGSIPLGSISLADLPVDTSGGWRALLDCAGQAAAGCDSRFAGVALQALTFTSVIGLPQVQALDLQQLDLGATPLGSIPLGSIALANVPLGSIPLVGDLACDAAAEVGVSCDDLEADPVTLLSLALAGVPLGSIPLGSIPLGSIPLGSIPLGSIPLGSIDIGATPLGSIPLGSIPLGSIPLGSIPLGSIPLGSIPLGSIPLGSIPLGSIDMGSTPLGSIPLGSIPLGSIPLGSIPLGSIPLGSIPLGSIPLGSIPLGSIPLGSIGTIVDCSQVDCAGGTLADALAAGAFLPGATLSDLQAGTLQDLLGWAEFEAVLLGELPGGVFADLEGWADLAELPLADLLHTWDPGDLFVLDDIVRTLFGGTTLAQLVAALPQHLADTLTLGALLGGLLPRADYPWESVDLDAPGIRSAAVGSSAPVEYTATIAVVDGPADVALAVELPAGSSFVAGSAFLGQDQLDDPAATGAVLQWSLPALATGTHVVTFSARAGMTLGPATTTATATILDVATASFTGEVTDQPDVGATPASAQPLEPDAITLSHIGEKDDVDLYRLVVGGSSLVSISLSNLTFDGDLVLYSPEPDLPGDDPVHVLPPVDETVAALSTQETEVQPQTLDDVPRLDLPIYAVAAGRGTGDEVIDTAPLRPGSYFIQVSGYNGGFGTEPYALRAKVLPGPEAPVCQARELVLGGHGQLPSFADLPAGLDTIFLVNEQRLAAMHPGELPAVTAALAQAAAADEAGVVGAVIPIDGDPAVRSAYQAWDTATGRCSPAAANRVAGAISDLVQQVRTARPTVRNVVLVGPDDQLPMGRLPDTTTYANERGFGPTLPTFDEVSSSLRAGYLLSDDVYADVSPMGVGDARFYVPDIAVGRLVHSPDQIVAALERFVATDGIIEDESGLVTGYDFLTDGANAIVAGLDANARQLASLIDDSWTRADLVDALLPAGREAPNLAAINAHFDPARALPAAGNAAHNEDDLFTTDDIRAVGGAPLVGRLLFSMGCHAGLNLPTDADTWAKTFADQGALWVANTGYGYGDTEVVALSELLMSHFAENLDGPTTIGDALAFAKHRFVAGLGAVTAYDMKSLMEATFYGLPMYRLRSGIDDPPGPPAPPAPPPTTIDPRTGLSVTSVTVEPDLVRQTSDGGDWYEANGGTVAVAGRPLQPKVTVDVTRPAAGDPDPGRGLAEVAHGALLTDLTSRDIGGFTPRIVRPIVDLASNETPPRPSDVAFPSSFQSVRDGHSAAGRHQNLVLVPGQFVSNPQAGDGTGTQRLFETMSADVFFAPPDVVDFEPPLITRTVSQVLPGAVAFTVDAVDVPGPVTRVLVLWSEVPDALGGVREWQSLDLAETSPGRWSGGVSVPGLDGSSQVEYLVQAVDGAGNVGISTNKGLLFHALAAPAPGDLTFVVSGPSAGPGLYTGEVTIAVEDLAGTASYYLDGVGPTPLTGPVTVAGDGVHLLEVTTTSGQRGAHSFVIIDDDTAPDIVLRSPADSSEHIVGAAVVADYECTDPGGLGVASCTGTEADGDPVDTGSIGAKTFTVEAVDVFGNEASKTAGYRVVYGICPVGPLRAKAGATLQVEVRVCDAAGGNLSTSGRAMTAVSVDGRRPDTTAAARDTTFKYHKGHQSHTIGIKTKGLAPGTHTLVVTVAGDPVPKTVVFTLT